MSADQRWVDARAAAKHLGIQLRTLYAYVSRGAVRSSAGKRGRPRLYALADLERLRVRRDARAGHGAVAAGALRWGEPVLDSAITAITSRGPAYRGWLAVELAAGGAGHERVAELLWTGVLPPDVPAWPRAAVRRPPKGAHPLDAMALVVAQAQLDDPASRVDVLPAARMLIAQLATCLGGGRGRTIAEIAARALGVPDAAPALDVVLVLLADHELNASTFAARVAASTGATVYACVAAALATLSGPKHGRAAEQPDEVLAGMGHPLYPHGDPRAAPLLEMCRGTTSRRAKALLALVAASSVPPSVDVGLAAFVASLGAPPEAASGLFAVARAAGWIAHALEQREMGVVLRPRARYVGR